MKAHNQIPKSVISIGSDGGRFLTIGSRLLCFSWEDAYESRKTAL